MFTAAAFWFWPFSLLRLVVVIQMIPAILTLWGIVKELVAGKGKEKEAKVEIRH
ncbi:hypothetical protein [Geotalea toluenoxydans]|uniref:hypothetical protein n=1 Tax=Geotalea toluenoxydans TaxID=421624 RepID=UPI001FB390FE|nr:hypothetical protein [Geotalea toluenoxydans]